MNTIARLKKRNKLAYIACWILFFLYGTAVFADLLAPYPPGKQHREKSFAPPAKIRFRDSRNNFHIRPFVYDWRLTNISGKTYEEDRVRIYPVKFFVTGPERKIWGLIPTDKYLFGCEEPAKVFLLGADIYGRDIFSRILFGARISLSFGLIGVAISFFLGLIIGGIAGYLGGRTDIIIMRLVELFMVFPAFYLMLALRAVFPLNISSLQIYIIMIVILSFVGWAGLARIIRGMVLALKEEEYVLAAKALGLSTLTILRTHILPNTVSYTVTALTLSIPGYILGESALSLLGLGIQEPYASWGNMLSSVVGNIKILLCFPWMLVPGLFIFLTIICFNFLGDGLRDVLDPKTW